MKTIPSLIFFQIIIFTLSLLPFFLNIRVKGNRLYINQSQSYKNCVILLGIVFCIFASYGGDWYHYYDIVEMLSTRINPYTHLEWIHIIIIKNLSFGIYLFWRLLIWGTAILFVFLSFRRLNEDNLITWSCFICVSVLQMSTGRVYLGIAMLFYGFSCIIKPRGKTLSIIKGILFMTFSLLFHKSIFIFLVASLLAIVKIKAWVNTLGLLLLPILAKLFTHILVFYLIGTHENRFAEEYLEAETINKGPGEAIYFYSFRLFLFLLIFLSFCFITKNRLKDSSRKIFQYSFNLTYIFLVIYLALTFNHIGSSSISGRVLQGLYFPTSVLFSKMIQQNYKIKANIKIFIALYFVNIYQLIYAYYLQSIG